MTVAELVIWLRHEKRFYCVVCRRHFRVDDVQPATLGAHVGIRCHGELERKFVSVSLAEDNPRRVLHAFRHPDVLCQRSAPRQNLSDKERRRRWLRACGRAFRKGVE